MSQCTLPPPGHVVLSIDTDAPLPPAPSELLVDSDSGEGGWLFDTLRVEAMSSGDPEVARVIPGTRAEFDLHRGMFATEPVSLAVVPEAADEPLFLSVTIFRRLRAPARYDTTEAGLLARLCLRGPGEHGRANAWVQLVMQSLELSMEQSLLCHDGRKPDEPLRQVSKGARACDGARDEEVCISAGTFWMGDTELIGNRGEELEDADRERLVKLSPFYIDREEVTAAQFFRIKETLYESQFSPGLCEGSCQCPEADAQTPMVCVDWDSAAAYCRGVGKQLPTEAMWEYVASGLGQDRRYPWGQDAPECDATILARGSGQACVARDGSGPQRAGTGERDRVDVRGDETIYDLAGNVAEWTADTFTPQAELAMRRLWVDPTFDVGFGGTKRVVKGGSFATSLVHARAAARAQRISSEARPDLGFRCARRAD